MIGYALLGIVLGVAALPASAVADKEIVLRSMGSFHVGGRLVEVSGKQAREVVFSKGGVPAKIDPNGFYQVDQMYVQYFLPKKRRGKIPLLMWHGGASTGAVYETTPDGREGWLNLFIRRGWDVFNSDAVERGRSGFASPEIWKGEPFFRTVASTFELLRIGAGVGSWSLDPAQRKMPPGQRFPVEAYDTFVKQLVPQWLNTDEAILAAYAKLVDRVCPCAILSHSQAGAFAFRVAQTLPHKVKALVLVEPAAGGDLDKVAAIASIPVLMLFGDYIEQDSRWTKIKRIDLDYAAAVRAAGGKVDVVSLPDIGIKGNSHMLMLDENSAEVAELIHKWLAGKGLVSLRP